MVRLSVDDEAAELVDSLLWDAGTTGIATIDGMVLAGFVDRETAEAVALAAGAGDWPATVVAIEPSEWSGTDEVTTVTVGSGPAGASRPARAISIVAGPTFGHGGHPTTVLAIDLLSDEVERRRSVQASVAVLDVGTGSGVLAIAAAAIGAGPVIGIDIDPEAIGVARANAERNGVDVVIDEVTVDAAPSLAGGRGFDVVVANVLSPVQRQLARSMAAVLAPGASLVTTGYLEADGPDVIERHRAAIERAGRGPVALAAERRRDGWLGHRFDLVAGD